MTIDAFHLIFIATTFAASLAAVILFFKRTPDNGTNIELELTKKQLEQTNLALQQEEEKLDTLNERIEQSIRNETAAKERLNALEGEKAKLIDEVKELKVKLEAEREAKNRADNAKTSFEEQKKALEERIAEQKKFIEEAQKNLKEQFENISNKQLEQSAEKFIKNSSENLGSILNPLKENIEKFKNEFTEKHLKDATAFGVLEKNIERIVAVNDKMTQTTENLTKALKGDNKMQGNWGEMLLEKLLEDSGLKKDIHYSAQESFNTEEGGRHQPDFLIKLPEGKHIIVDSKVSLVAYEKYFNEMNDDAKILHAKAFADSVKAHVKGLGDKRYQDNAAINTLDYVIMFMPIEGTFQLLNQYAPDIFQYGWANKVVITSPVTLFPVLQTISSIWKVEAQNRNTQEIVRTASSLYDKFLSFAESLEKVGAHIKKSEEAYSKSLEQLKDGRGNAVSIIRRLEELGIEKRKKGKTPSLMQGVDATTIKTKDASDDDASLQEDAA
jgi:DNA recombination protein RmuC